MKRLGIVLLILTSITIQAQGIDSDFVEGKWKVTSVEQSPADPPFSLMTASFKNATFIFNEDQTVSLKTTVQNGFFRLMSDVVNDSTWSISNESIRQSIVVQGLGGKKNLEIFVTQQGDDVFFELGEQGDRNYFMLKAEKQ